MSVSLCVSLSLCAVVVVAAAAVVIVAAVVVVVVVGGLQTDGREGAWKKH